MKYLTIKSAWMANPPSAPQASAIVATISIAGAIIFGLIAFQPLLFGGIFGHVNMLFAISAIHLLLQAIASAKSWKTGAMFAIVSLIPMFVLAITFLVQFDFKTPAAFSVSAIVSIAAVKNHVNQFKPTIRG